MKANNSAGSFEHAYNLKFEGRRVEPKKKRYFENVTIANEALPRIYAQPKPVKEPTPPPVTEEPEPQPQNEWEVEAEGENEISLFSRYRNRNFFNFCFFFSNA